MAGFSSGQGVAMHRGLHQLRASVNPNKCIAYPRTLYLTEYTLAWIGKIDLHACYDIISILFLYYKTYTCLCKQDEWSVGGGRASTPLRRWSVSPNFIQFLDCQETFRKWYFSIRPFLVIDSKFWNFTSNFTFEYSPKNVQLFSVKPSTCMQISAGSPTVRSTKKCQPTRWRLIGLLAMGIGSNLEIYR